MVDFLKYSQIIIYLELTYNDKQNGGQSFNLRARIAELWQFKAQKVAIFKPGC